MSTSTVPTLADVEIAQGLDKQLRARTDAMVHAVDQWAPFVRHARAAEIWRALGFDSWPLYISDVIATSLGKMKLPIDRRRELVALLSAEGMSLREIASGMGVSKSTVDRDRNPVPSQNGTAPPVDLDSDDHPEPPTGEKREPSPEPPPDDDSEDCLSDFMWDLHTLSETARAIRAELSDITPGGARAALDGIESDLTPILELRNWLSAVAGSR